MSHPDLTYAEEAEHLQEIFDAAREHDDVATMSESIDGISELMFEVRTIYHRAVKLGDYCEALEAAYQLRLIRGCSYLVGYSNNSQVAYDFVLLTNSGRLH